MHNDNVSNYAHSHRFLGDNHEAHEKRTRYVVALTAAMMVVEIVAGWLTSSMALLADGFHMATHAGALGVAAWAYAYSSRHADDGRFTFGTGKVGDLAGFASAMVLAIIAVGIGVSSIERLFVHVNIAYGQATWIAVLGLAVNIASASLLSHGVGDGPHRGHKHPTEQSHDHGHDNNLRSAYFHVIADALTSVLAIGALLAGRYLGWAWMDASMGVVGAVVIARWSWGLLRDTGAILVDGVANLGLEAEIRAAIEQGEVCITDLHVWRVGPGKFAAIVALVTDHPLPPSAYVDRVRFHKELVHVTVEVSSCEGQHPHLRAA